MSDKVFVDTNVLIYGYDVDAGDKHERAKRILKGLWVDRSGVLSIQVLQEFYVNVTRKIAKPLKRAAARGVVDSYAVWEVVSPTVEHLVRASELKERHKLSFWDAMIIVAAGQAGATKLLSEDLQDGRRIHGVTIENPFA
ncbi:MAG: PIN domain-containing protein [Myxococcales bacterium]|nr:PIN domain-containing protein [Myxococcales bacterium]